MNKLYMVYDRVAGLTVNPILNVRTEGQAIRIFAEAVRNPETSFHKNPDDFELMYLGEQNEETGEITGILPRTILVGSALLAGTPVRDEKLTPPTR